MINEIRNEFLLSLVEMKVEILSLYYLRLLINTLYMNSSEQLSLFTSQHFAALNDRLSGISILIA